MVQAGPGAQVAVANLAPPAVRPLHQTRAMPDVLLDVARRLRQPLAPPLPETFEEVLQAAFAALPKPSGSQAEAADDPWTTVQEQGGWWGATSAAPDTHFSGVRLSGMARRLVTGALVLAALVGLWEGYKWLWHAAELEYRR